MILADGLDDEKPKYAAMQAGLLETLGMAGDDARSAKFEQATRLQNDYFTLADEIVAGNPRVVD